MHENKRIGKIVRNKTKDVGCNVSCKQWENPTETGNMTSLTGPFQSSSILLTKQRNKWHLYSFNPPPPLVKLKKITSEIKFTYQTTTCTRACMCARNLYLPRFYTYSNLKFLSHNFNC